MINVIDVVKFDDICVNVYGSLDEPLFRAMDIANIIASTGENLWDILELCEEDEILYLPKTIDDGFSYVFITETGLYNLLAQSRKPIARKWRRIIIRELIDLRKERNMDIVEQFEDWDHQLDDLYFDEEKGVMMISITVQGGDVIQEEYEGDI